MLIGCLVMAGGVSGNVLAMQSRVLPEEKEIGFEREAVIEAVQMSVVKADAFAQEVPQRIQEEQERRRQEEEARKQAEEEARRQAEEAERQRAQEMARSQEEENLLAALIYCEAGGEPYEGQVAVGAVVLNRVRSSSFPNSIEEVIYQSGQFGPAVTGKLGRVLASGKTTDSCRQAAKEALEGSNPIGDALYFGNGNSGQLIGNHYFH
ncbi:MAG: cell wall hydrolase [Lachnospiraceae bacterium]|nr:cell wall hydrolase [Lachnospiraceae bacterium]